MGLDVRGQNTGAGNAIPQIELQHPRAAAHVADALGNLVGLAAPRPAMHHHVVAVIGQAQRDGAPDAAGWSR